MEPELFKTLGGIAGIGGVALGIVFLLFRDVIARSIFPKLTQAQGFKLLRLLTVAVWSIGVIGVLVWAFPPGTRNTQVEAIGGVAGGGEIEASRIEIRGPTPAAPEAPEKQPQGSSVRAVGGVAGGGDVSGTTIVIDSTPAAKDKPE
jgi:hypothetical protein